MAAPVLFCTNAYLLLAIPRPPPQVEQLLLGYVQPCFASPYGHLRAKACWVAGMYCDTEFAGEGKGKGPKYGSLLQAVMRCLGDSELPVQVRGGAGASDLHRE